MNMKFGIWNLKTTIVLFSAMLICLSGFGFDINAQTKKRKKTTQAVVPQPTPPPIGVPIIISRAADIPSENQIIVPETQTDATPTMEDKIDQVNSGITDLKTRVKSLESTKQNEYDEKQKRLLLNLDILSRAEQRSENLRKQLYDLIDKENSIRSRLEQINNDSRPEMIERSVALVGTLHPEDLRDARKKSLQGERANLETLLNQIVTNRANLETNVQKSDTLVDKLRSKLEKDIDDALTDEKPN